jgi:hypothetical protein
MRCGHALTSPFAAPTWRAMLPGMRHGSRRRASPDPLEPISETTWLVVRNALSQVLECSELAPRTDLRALLTAARDARLAADSTVTPP